MTLDQLEIGKLVFSWQVLFEVGCVLLNTIWVIYIKRRVILDFIQLRDRFLRAIYVVISKNWSIKFIIAILLLSHISVTFRFNLIYFNSLDSIRSIYTVQLGPFRSILIHFIQIGPLRSSIHMLLEPLAWNL